MINIIHYQASGYLLKWAAKQLCFPNCHAPKCCKQKWDGKVLCLWPFLTQNPKLPQHFGKIWANTFNNWLMFQRHVLFQFLDILWMVQNRCKSPAWSNRFQFKIQSHVCKSFSSCQFYSLQNMQSWLIADSTNKDKNVENPHKYKFLVLLMNDWLWVCIKKVTDSDFYEPIHIESFRLIWFSSLSQTLWKKDHSGSSHNLHNFPWWKSE